ncbi:MAG TPA: phenylalanine--tRNA ligase beta subunit-related protein [Vicinamibacterales bacterium]|nr:phenylalanine--tRNA ligase beta subunit-related protein [Vicinamibacterales bacterium]
MTDEANPVATDAALASIVRPAAWLAGAVTVVDRDPRLDVPLAAAEEALRASVESADVTTAVRTMYKQVGIDPTKTRPSSEALLRRVRKGDALPRINSLVDVINWCSVESQLPFGLYDSAKIQGAIALRLGRAGESYAGIRKDSVNVDGRLTLVDDIGPFGNPTSDSARTMVTSATTRALVVIYAPAPLSGSLVERAVGLTTARIREFCQ